MIAEATKACAKCGLVLPLSEFYKIGTSTGRVRSDCKECCKARVCLWQRTEAVRERRRLSAQQNAGKYLYNHTRHRAKDRGLSFTLTEEWFVEKVKAGVCELTGLPFGKILENDPYAPSPDRIVNEIGYEDGNGRMILWWLNQAKKAMPEDQFQRCIADLVGAMRDRV